MVSEGRTVFSWDRSTILQWMDTQPEQSQVYELLYFEKEVTKFVDWGTRIYPEGVTERSRA